MENELEEVSLAEVTTLRNGAGVKQIYFANKGVPLARVSDFTMNSIDLTECNYVDEKHAKTWSSHLLFDGDVVVATVGSWPPNWSSVVGKVVRTPTSAEGAIQNQNTCCILPSSDKLDKTYLYYRLKCEDFAWHAANNAGGSANQARLPVKKIGDFRFSLPNLVEQKSIANTLGSLDDKIELNRQVNETLEAMAQALFKSWFVDFDPVIDNALAAGNEIPEPLQKRAAARQALGDQRKPLPADIQSLFPDRFVFTDEMGWVPEGWDIGVFADICDIRKGLSYKGKSLTDDATKTPMMNLGNFGGAGKFRTEKIKYYDGEYKDRHHVRTGQLMIANTDMTQDRVVLGSPIVVPSFQSSEVIFTHHTFAVDFNAEHSEEVWKWYVYFVSLGSEFRKRAEGFSTGTTVLAMPKDALLQCAILLPHENIVEAFVKKISPFFSKRDLSNEQNLELSKTRDTLLPKLLSGELRIADAEKQVAEAL